VASSGVVDTLMFTKDGAALELRNFCSVAESIVHSLSDGAFLVRLTITAALSTRDQRTSRVLEYVANVCESMAPASAAATDSARTSRSSRSSFVASMFSGRRSSRTASNTLRGRDPRRGSRPTSSALARRHGSNVSLRSRSPSTHATTRIDETRTTATVDGTKKDGGGSKAAPKQRGLVRVQRSALEDGAQTSSRDVTAAAAASFADKAGKAGSNAQQKQQRTKSKGSSHDEKTDKSGLSGQRQQDGKSQDSTHDPKVIEELTREVATLRRERNSLHKSLHDLQFDPNNAANLASKFPTQAEVIDKYETFLLQGTSLIFDLYDSLGETAHAAVGAMIKRCALQANKVVGVWHQSQLAKARSLAELDASMMDHAHKLFCNVLQMTLTWDKALPEKVLALLSKVLDTLPEGVRRSSEFFPQAIFRLGRYRLASSSDIQARWDTIGMETGFNSQLHSPIGPTIKHKDNVMVLLPALTVNRGHGESELLCKAVVTDM
jgi:hypothetical protein